MMIPSVFLGIVLFGSNEISGEIASFTSESIVGADSAPVGGNKEGGGFACGVCCSPSAKYLSSSTKVFCFLTSEDSGLETPAIWPASIVPIKALGAGTST